MTITGVIPYLLIFQCTYLCLLWTTLDSSCKGPHVTQLYYYGLHCLITATMALFSCVCVCVWISFSHWSYTSVSCLPNGQKRRITGLPLSREPGIWSDKIEISVKISWYTVSMLTCAEDEPFTLCLWHYQSLPSSMRRIFPVRQNST